jgi:hypothetical protein
LQGGERRLKKVYDKAVFRRSELQQAQTRRVRIESGGFGVEADEGRAAQKGSRLADFGFSRDALVMRDSQKDSFLGRAACP